MVKNERGSVMSIALIVLTILTFSISSVSVYTYNVASRSNSEIQSRNENDLARSIINASMSEIKNYIVSNPSLAPFDVETIKYIDDEKISVLESWYEYYEDEERFGLRVGKPIETTEKTILYRVRYDKLDGETVFRELFISLEESAEPDNMDEAFRSIVSKIINDENTEWICEDEEEECEADEAFVEEFGEFQGQSSVIWGFALDEETTVAVQGDLSVSGHIQQGELLLNGSTLLIDGDLILDEIKKIVGPGMIIVTGNIDAVQTFDLTIKHDVLILVYGNTDLSLEHNNAEKRKLIAEDGDFAWLTLKDDPNDVVLQTGNVENIYNTIDNDIEDAPADAIFVQHDDDFAYLGSIYYDPLDWNTILNDYTVEYEEGYSFGDGSFQVEEDD